MQYLGGKTRIAKQLAEVIDRTRKPGQWVWDPFCGGLSMSVALSKNGPVWSTDVNAALINLYLAVQQGWQPPTEVSRETYAAAKSLPDTDPMKAFCGFGCSFGGKWFGGYSAPRPKYARPADGVRKVLMRDVPARLVSCVDFLSVAPRTIEAIIYADPPYAGTTGYAGSPSFDPAAFYALAAHWALFTDVFVSEYACPIGVCVWQGQSKTSVNCGVSGSVKHATERLYHLPKGSVWRI
jgi:DNA adenine methylase